VREELAVANERFDTCARALEAQAAQVAQLQDLSARSEQRRREHRCGGEDETAPVPQKCGVARKISRPCSSSRHGSIRENVHRPGSRRTPGSQGHRAGIGSSSAEGNSTWNSCAKRCSRRMSCTLSSLQSKAAAGLAIRVTSENPTGKLKEIVWLWKVSGRI